MQFLRNKCLCAWIDQADEGKSKEAISAYTAVLAKDFPFAGRLGSQARQAASERAWKAVDRFYANCEAHQPGKKGSPAFRKIAGPLSTKPPLVGNWPPMAGISRSVMG